MLDMLKTENKIIGTKQVKRALQSDDVKIVFIANDADSRVVKDILELAKGKKLEVVYANNMRELGKACGIDVNAASAAILK